jgi:signal transduction histidine kinase/CheY-like chemotaxis protein
MKGYPADTSGDITRHSSSPATNAGERAVVRLTRLAAQLLRTPGALITTPELTTPLFLTPTGTGQLTLEDWNDSNTRAICDYICTTGTPILIRGLSGHKSATTPIEPLAVSYAGVPIGARAGGPLGALCTIDHLPRDWTATELSALREIAGIIETLPPFSNHPRLEAQVRQSLKLEAVGRLAGGIAHDFNNILTAIRGHADLLLDDVSATHPNRIDIEEIRRSTDRAALLTHQLLAFSRRQVLQPRPFDLIALLPTWAEKLREDLDERIYLKLDRIGESTPVRADPSQIERALQYVVANAAEALPAGGIITISATNSRLEEPFAREFPYRVQPGPYVRLAVTDNGRGMNEETLERIFEPFFTSKDPALGTGLGLSTVYGIIKQSEGYIWAQSSEGHGTTIEIFLPRIENYEENARAASNGDDGPAHKTILLVEDEEVIRSLARRILSKLGYTILEASSGEEALRLAEGHIGEIDLLLTDLTMPGMPGRELAQKITTLRPRMRTLFTSGYTDDEEFRRGIDHLGGFLEKPFTYETLVYKVGEVLN